MLQSDGILHMDDESFVRFSTHITENYGIKLAESKRSMLESRLNRKVREMGFHQYKEFVDYFLGNECTAIHNIEIVDRVTTNKTDFFREPSHFSYLSEQYLLEWLQNNGGRPLRVWSAACSTGEEPYTIMMTLELFKEKNPEFRYVLFGSDLSMRALRAAYYGIYTLDRITTIPTGLQRKFFQRSVTEPRFFRIRPEYRKKLALKRFNLIGGEYEVGGHKYDIVFCRNALIYFSRLDQEQIINSFARVMDSEGILFLGHSESTIGMTVPFRQIRPTIYRRI